jgi:hypothetical protein
LTISSGVRACADEVLIKAVTAATAIARADQLVIASFSHLNPSS